MIDDPTPTYEVYGVDVRNAQGLAAAKATVPSAAPALKALSGTDLCNVKFHADRLAEKAIVAYWLENCDDTAFRLHANGAHDSFTTLAELMGYRVVPK